MKNLTSWEEFKEWLPVIVFTTVIVIALAGLAFGIETVRASIWANAIRNTGCTCPSPLAGDL